MPPNKVTHTPWSRTKTIANEDNSMRMSYTEFLNMSDAGQRLLEAIQYRGEAGATAWMDHALNGTLGDLTPEADAA